MARIGSYEYPDTQLGTLLKTIEILIEKFNATVPDSLDELLSLPGVGRKTANLVLTEGFKINAICVDTHVHRISNRVGYVKTTTADKTEMALRKKLPEKYWIIYNEILVAFGQALLIRGFNPDEYRPATQSLIVLVLLVFVVLVALGFVWIW